MKWRSGLIVWDEVSHWSDVDTVQLSGMLSAQKWPKKSVMLMGSSNVPGANNFFHDLICTINLGKTAIRNCTSSGAI